MYVDRLERTKVTNMDNSPKKDLSKPASIAVFIMCLGSLAWSFGAIGMGIWQSSRLDSETTQNGLNANNFIRVPNVPAGVFNYGGSTAWAALRLAVDSVIQSERPEIQFRYVQSQDEPPGSSPGIEMLLNGQLAFVQSSNALTPQEYQLAQQRGLKLKQIPVAVDGIAVAVHPNLDLAGLTLKQLQAIYTGEISNWQELGGTDLPITAYSRPTSTGGIVDFFTSKILKNQQFGSNVAFVPTTTQALRRLASDRGGIYYGSAAAIIAQCTVKPLPLADERDLVAPYQLPLVSASECPHRRNKTKL